MDADAELWRPEVVPGERIFLSQVLRADVPQLARWFADLELTTYINAVGASFSPADEQKWFEGQSASGGAEKNFAIVVREGRRMIGNVGLKAIDQRHGIAELGIAIGDKEAWGKGYGSEAVRLMADYGLTFLGLHAISLWHIAFNERGHRAYLKAGFKEVGRLRESFLFDGRRYDRVLMDITRDDLGPSRLAPLIGQIAP